MKCPKCGIDMESGEIASGRGDESLYWAPNAFFDKHWLNPYCHTAKTIQEEGGVIIRTNSRLHKASVCYGCRKCKVVVVDCN